MIINSIIKMDMLSNTNEWKEARKQYIGSSEIAAICGLSKYKTRKDILLQKLGYEEKDINENMAAGHIFEPIVGNMILPYYEENTVITYENIHNNKIVRNVKKDNSVYKVNIVHGLDVVPIMVSPDFVDTDTNIPYDIKVTNPFTFKSFKESTDIHDYIWQCILQQIVYDVNEGYLFFMVSPSQFELYKVIKSEYEPLLENLIGSLHSFYQELEYYKDKPYEEIIKTYDINEMFSIPEIKDKNKEEELTILDIDLDKRDVTLSDGLKHQYPNMPLSEILSELSKTYIEYNEEYKVLSKKQDAIKNIIRQILFENYNKITVQYPDYNISIRLKPFKIDIL